MLCEVVVMRRKTIALYLAIAGVVIVVSLGAWISAKSSLIARIKMAAAFPRGNEASKEAIVTRDISAELAKMKAWSESIEMPKDQKIAARVRSVLETARQFWKQCQELVNSRNVNISYWNGLYTGMWQSKDQREAVSLTFKSAQGKIRSARKRFFADEALEVEIKSERLKLELRDDLTGPEWFHANNGREILAFYPDNKVSLYNYNPQGNTWHTIKWDEEGNIVRQRTEVYEPPNDR